MLSYTCPEGIPPTEPPPGGRSLKNTSPMIRVVTVTAWLADYQPSRIARVIIQIIARQYTWRKPAASSVTWMV